MEPDCKDCEFSAKGNLYIIDGKPILVKGDFCLWAPGGTRLSKGTYCVKSKDRNFKEK